MTRTINVRYSAVDGYRETSTFKSLTAARKFAQHWVGEHPDLGSSYAVSSDGVGKIETHGATLAELFPEQSSLFPTASRE